MPRSQPYLYVRTLQPSEADAAAVLLGRGMCDNPIHVAVYGGDDASRARRHELLMRTRLRTMAPLQMEGVDRGDELVGVAAWVRPGCCRPSPSARLQLLARAVTFGPRTAARLLSWNDAWSRHDPEAPHVHLGPVAVDQHLRGQGIGTLLMLRHAGWLDATGAEGYLETDRLEAVGFYRRFGYVVVGEAEVLGVPCWFMRRPAA